MIQYDRTTYGIIGNPVKHSLSPLMHNCAFRELGVDASYELIPLEENELEDFFRELKSETCPIFGLNVTVPYKEKALLYMDTISPFAERVGAVNTVIITDERKFIGYNTDGPGFITHLNELKFNPADKDIVILGAGGSARAIVAALCLVPQKPRSLKIYNRTASRLDNLLNEMAQRLDVSLVEPVMSIDDLNIDTADMLINTTSVGLNRSDPVLIEEDLFHPGMFVYDLIYNPAQTPLLTMAAEKGALTANGLGMLFYQGVLSFQHWANMELDEGMKLKMRQALEEGAEG